MPTKSSVGYCACGCEILVEYLVAEECWTCRFLDEDFREITHCPQCGVELIDDELESM